jgi:ketosteroid isomerase-like protein
MTGQLRCLLKRRGSEAASGCRLSLFLCFLFGSTAFGCGFERQEPDQTPDSAAAPAGVAGQIEAMLTASAVSWNGGDLEGFLDDYWRSEDLTFSDETGVTRGWDALRSRYLNSYWAPGAARDSLRFQNIEVTELGTGHALAMGQYVLYSPEDDGLVTSTGYFSLVLRRLEGRWKILHDHTSAAPDPDDPQEGGS